MLTNGKATKKGSCLTLSQNPTSQPVVVATVYNIFFPGSVTSCTRKRHDCLQNGLTEGLRIVLDP